MSEMTGTVPLGSTERWTDKKRYLWLIGLVVPSLAFLAIGLHAATGWGVWFWIGPIVILAIVPAIDLVAGLDRSNPPDDVIERLEQDRYYRWITYLFLPIQYVGFVFAFWLIARGELSVVDKVGLAISIGCIGGIGINTAHELGHKKESHERWLSKIALAQSFYGHFYIEHNRGHHVRVATPEDPASSRVGESFYRFWPRTVFGSLKSAWGLERKRYARRDKHPFRIGNDVLNAWLMSAVLWVAMVAWLGFGILPYLVIQAVIGFSLLEVVNYMEHYGMLRQKVGPPERRRYERVDPSHSWNSNNIATNVLLYHLQRHSDHHANPTRRYQTLRDFAESPVLPTGYAGMIVLALFPPLWRRVMDQRVLNHFDGDLSRANIQPSKRDKVLARYGTSATETAAVPDDVRGDASEGGMCPGCGYVYDEQRGDPREGFPAGTPWASIPDSWCCPDCGVREKVDFVAPGRMSV
ncbi:alkane 1-monooxygenase [Amycolatopsis rubida]|uniref:Alkane 1-monooxygenase n=1 Tax=Amycolatopsis rubida TaxID=112413 RepID=A0A1I5W9H7_9PSEU|nr:MULTISPECIES: fatty acid desaturase [Amycolatopsis]MYW95271.1 alkane 1-monooxygenase [Amycolatopsis rubida]NEC60260.1 alkane 1-monooxygenase [Amycolatopsis rubida]OAP28329.1 Alkane 1-monooxygenase [Amycolatopsis sp. M39]SFQ16384.1 alkane 1-monooxygenase [Amycolatopsis rubida]